MCVIGFELVSVVLNTESGLHNYCQHVDEADRCTGTYAV